MTPPINPDKDFAGFVEERLRVAVMTALDGAAKTSKAWSDQALEQAGPDDIPAIEDLANHFTRAAHEINEIAKAIRRKHGITTEDEHQRWCEAMKKRRAE